MTDLKSLDKKKAILDARRPLPQGTVNSLRENLLVEWTYHSNAIEGNTLTLKETKVVLEGITVGGKSMTEHIEAINHRDAILFVEEIVKNPQPLSEWQIKNIHAIVLKGIDPKNAGIYRKENVLISGAKHIPPDYIVLNDQMQALISWYTGDGIQLHPVELAAMVHTRFVGIHPFVDGNGRTARLLLNLELMKAGYPPIVIRKEDRLDYYDALDLAHTSDVHESFLKLVLERAHAAMDLYLKLIGKE